MHMVYIITSIKIIKNEEVSKDGGAKGNNNNIQDIPCSFFGVTQFL